MEQIYAYAWMECLRGVENTSTKQKRKKKKNVGAKYSLNYIFILPSQVNNNKHLSLTYVPVICMRPSNKITKNNSKIVEGAVNFDSVLHILALPF